MRSESEDKSGDNITSDYIINIKSWAMNIDKFLVCHSCAKDYIL